MFEIDVYKIAMRICEMTELAEFDGADFEFCMGQQIYFWELLEAEWRLNHG